jgi:hypothetical protein
MAIAHFTPCGITVFHRNTVLRFQSQNRALGFDSLGTKQFDFITKPLRLIQQLIHRLGNILKRTNRFIAIREVTLVLIFIDGGDYRCDKQKCLSCNLV